MDKVLGQEDYFKGYQDNIDELKKENKEAVEFDKMCYEVFNSETGKTLLDFLRDKIVLAAVPHGINDSYANACVYYEGYREGYRQMIHAVKSYPERRDAEEKSKLRGAQ